MDQHPRLDLNQHPPRSKRVAPSVVLLGQNLQEASARGSAFEAAPFLESLWSYLKSQIESSISAADDLDVLDPSAFLRIWISCFSPVLES
jgi:hypothetical protein